jgi:DNA polymerase IV (DinB-like DNA polymerase)
MGIETAGDLATADPHALTDAFGDRGRELYDRARGADTRPVTPTGDPKSLSRESAFAEAVEDAERKREQVRALAGAVADRARSRGALYRTIGVKAVTPPYDVNTRERSLPGPIDDPELVERIALEQIAEFDDAAVRKVGVRVSNLEFPSGEQARLSGWDADSGGNNGAGPTDGEGRNESSSGGESGQSSLADFSDRS